jgi:hypothetical protein
VDGGYPSPAVIAINGQKGADVHGVQMPRENSRARSLQDVPYPNYSVISDRHCHSAGRCQLDVANHACVTPHTADLTSGFRAPRGTEVPKAAGAVARGGGNNALGIGRHTHDGVGV